MEEVEIDGMGFDVIFNEVEVGGVGYDVILPDGLNGLDQRMVDLDVVLIEDIISLHYDVEQIVLPLLLELRELRYLSDALVNQMLDLAVNVNVQFQLVVDQDD